MSEFINVKEASELYGKTKRYIQFLIAGRKRRKGNHVWYVSPKLHNIKYVKSNKNKQMALIDKAEIDKLFTKEH